MPMKLNDKVVIITGASRGIGRAIAKRFAQEGAKVVINYNKSEDKASRLVDEIRKNGGQALAVRADVSKSDEVKQLVKKTVETYGRVDILVNNARVMFQKTFLDATEEIWDQTIDINLKGAYLCSKEVAPIMLKQKKGKIINISSNSGAYHPSALRFVEYVVSKAGMNGLTRALALKLGPYVNVNAICPGWIETEMVGNTDPEVERRVLEETPLKRFGTADEVANAALYLASDDSNFVTGELHMITGGRGMH
jgi:3-oxoacyl-[acyl-carrier protein] reductase